MSLSDKETIAPEDLTGLHLDKGGHHSPEQGMCLMEAVAFVRGLPFTDAPPCVSPILGAYGRSLNDVLPDDSRQRLIPYIPALPGTAGDGLDESRGYLALDWIIRVYTPTWMRLVPALTAQADLLAGAGPIRTLDDAAAIGDLVREAAAQARTAWDAAGDAARAAAWDAAWDAARAAARAAARDALVPTVAALQDSAIDLFGTLIAGRTTQEGS